MTINTRNRPKSEQKEKVATTDVYIQLLWKYLGDLKMYLIRDT